jgi:hypothetical protein
MPEGTVWTDGDDIVLLDSDLTDCPARKGKGSESEEGLHIAMLEAENHALVTLVRLIDRLFEGDHEHEEIVEIYRQAYEARNRVCRLLPEHIMLAIARKT